MEWMQVVATEDVRRARRRAKPSPWGDKGGVAEGKVTPDLKREHAGGGPGMIV